MMVGRGVNLKGVGGCKPPDIGMRVVGVVKYYILIISYNVQEWGPSIYDVHTEGGGEGQAQVDACERGEEG